MTWRRPRRPGAAPRICLRSRPPAASHVTDGPVGEVDIAAEATRPIVVAAHQGNVAVVPDPPQLVLSLASLFSTTGGGVWILLARSRKARQTLVFFFAEREFSMRPSPTELEATHG